MRYGVLIISSFLLIVGCSTKTPSIEDNANQLRDELTILSESIRVNLESDNETINVSFEDDMLFAFGEYSVKYEFKNTLKILGDFLTKYPNFEISIEGHTDSIGDTHSNLMLSEQRALAVATVLIENNVSSQRINSIGYGESKPKYDNNTDEGRSGNRRAEIKLKKYLADKNKDSTIVSESEIVTIEDTDTPIEIIEESEYIEEQNIKSDNLAKERAKKKKAKQRAKIKKDKAKKAKQRAKLKREKAKKAKQAQIKREKEKKKRVARERAKREKEARQRATRAKEEQIIKEKEARERKAKERAEEEKERSSESII